MRQGVLSKPCSRQLLFLWCSPSSDERVEDGVELRVCLHRARERMEHRDQSIFELLWPRIPIQSRSERSMQYAVDGVRLPVECLSFLRIAPIFPFHVVFADFFWARLLHPLQFLDEEIVPPEVAHHICPNEALAKNVS